MHEDVIKGHHVYKKMWTPGPVCGEVLEVWISGSFGNSGQLARLRLKSSMRYYLKCAYSRRSTVLHRRANTKSSNMVAVDNAQQSTKQCLINRWPIDLVGQSSFEVAILSNIGSQREHKTFFCFVGKMFK